MLTVGDNGYRIKLANKLTVETQGQSTVKLYICFMNCTTMEVSLWFLCTVLVSVWLTWICFIPFVGHSPAETGFQRPSHYTSSVRCDEWLPKPTGIIMRVWGVKELSPEGVCMWQWGKVVCQLLPLCDFFYRASFPINDTAAVCFGLMYCHPS